MKYFSTRYLIAAAALVSIAGSASAEALKAEIPFAFRVGKALMAPGTYKVFTGRDSGVSAQVIRLSNFDSKSAALIMPKTKQDAAKEWIDSRVPKLAFDCADGRCELAQIWDGSDQSAFVLRPHGRGTQEMANSTVITVNAVKAD